MKLTRLFIDSINKSYVARHGLKFELFSILAHRWNKITCAIRWNNKRIDDTMGTELLMPLYKQWGVTHYNAVNIHDFIKKVIFTTLP